MKDITLENMLKNNSLRHIEQNLIYFYLKNNKINYKCQSVISDFLLDFDQNEDFSELFVGIKTILDLSKEFEHLVSLENKRENGAVYTPFSVVEKMSALTTIKETDMILEPSVGGGIFIFNILNYFKTNFNKNIQDTLKNNIFMNDIDKEVIERLYLLISIFALENNEIIDKSDINISNLDFISNDFNEFYSDLKFDIIIGNPPYLSLEKGFLKEDIEKYKKEYPCIFKVYDIFGIFIEKSIRYLTENGQLCFIVPSTLFTNDSFEKLRKLMLEYNIENCIHLGDSVFDNAVVPACIFKISNNPQQKNIKLEHEEKEYSLPISEIIGDKNSFRLGIDYKFNKEIIKYKENESNTTLGKLLNIKEAIKTGNDKKFITDVPNSLLKPLVKGRNINPLSINQKLYLNYDRENLSRPLNESFFEQNKIFIRRVSNKIIAAFDDNHLYATHTLYCAFDHGNNLRLDDFKLLEILLNSELYTKMYITLFPFKGTVFPEIRSTKLRQLIFPDIDKIRKNNNLILNCVKEKEINQVDLTNVIKDML